MSALPWLLVTSWMAGALGLAVLLGRDPRSWSHFAQALVLGPWLLAVEMLLFTSMGIELNLTTVLTPWWLLTAIGLWARRPLTRGQALPREMVLVAWLLFAIVLHTGLSEPIMGGDAAENFGVFARVIASSGEYDLAALEAGRVVGHFEYPPLVSFNEALYFLAGGDLGPTVAKALFALAYLALVLLFASAARTVRGRWTGLLVLLLFALQPDLLFFGTHGFAELPLVAACAWLAVEAWGVCASKAPPTARSLAAIVLPAMVAALTKNEGLMVATLTATALLFGGRRRRAGAAALILIGALAWPFFLHTQGYEGGFLSSLARGFTWSKLERFPAALGAFADGLFGFGRWPGRGVASLAWGTLALLVFGLTESRTRRRAAWVLALASLHIGIYALVFALTPRDFGWHLSTAADRLSVHLVPWSIPALLIFAGAPQRTKIGEDQGHHPHLRAHGLRIKDASGAPYRGLSRRVESVALHGPRSRENH